jgi:hypothetical protein
MLLTIFFVNKDMKKPDGVAHVCNPSFLVGKDQEDHGSKPAQANSSQGSLSTNLKKSL